MRNRYFRVARQFDERGLAVNLETLGCKQVAVQVIQAGIPRQASTGPIYPACNRSERINYDSHWLRITA